MMPHLEHVHIQGCAAIYQVPLCFRFHIAGEQVAGLAIVDAQHQGGVVGVLIGAHRPQQLHRGTAQRPGSTHSGDLHLPPLLLRILYKVLEADGGGIGHRAVHMIGGKSRQHSRQAAHMVLVGVGAEHIIQLLDSQVLQVGDHQFPIRHIAAIVQQVVAFTFYQNAQRLPHINKVCGQSLALGHRGRRSRFGRGGRRRGTGTDPQRQRSGQGQSCQAAGQRRKAYFFFFPVFHVVLSFC